MPFVSVMIWSGAGYAPIGFKLPCVQYELYTDKIRVTEGIFTRRVQEVPLYRIASMEIITNVIGRLFHCGQVHLIIGNRKVPDIYMTVRDPEKLLALIDQAKKDEQLRYSKKRKMEERRYAHDRKRV